FGITYAERPFLFHNLHGGKFEEFGERVGMIDFTGTRGTGGSPVRSSQARSGSRTISPFAHRYVARGTATADFFNRGAEDLLVTVLDGSPLLLRNESRRGHWLRIKTIGTRSNRDGFGARVEVKAGSLTEAAEVRANSSFESASDPCLHFGLGSATTVDSIVVHWPSGKVDTIGPQPADQDLDIEEGHGVIKPR